MPLTLQTVPGFADVKDSALAHDQPAFGLHISRISQNANYGMARFETFQALYHNGDTVILPTSDIDGYSYSRSELTYLWAVHSTLNPSTHWFSGPDSLWYGAWLVDQTTGAVSTEEGYRKSSEHHPDSARTSDGVLQVFTLAQRQKTSLTMAIPATNYTDIPDGDFTTDAPYDEAMAQRLNKNAKFGVVNAEAIYMGDFWGGQTIPRPVSPADGYQYTYAETKFAASWRWTVRGSSFAQPPNLTGQLGPIVFSINAGNGAVTITVQYADTDGALNTESTFGRIAVVALCSRNDLITSLPGVANAFAEIGPFVYFPGETLRATSLSQLNKNTRESAVSTEFFGPTEYTDGQTVPTPTSSKDSYAYSRAECQYVWEWSDTTPDTGTHLRTPGWWGEVNSETGVVDLTVWRLPPGGPVVEFSPSNHHMRVRVITIASRGAQHAALSVPSSDAPSDISSTQTDNTPADAPYAITFFGDPKGVANNILLRHPISGDVGSVAFAVNLPTSEVGALVAPTGNYVITIKQAGVTVGTMTIAAGATSGTFSFTSARSGAALEKWDFLEPATSDATIAGIWFTVSGIRT